jgi:hypothetical protein
MRTIVNKPSENRVVGQPKFQLDCFPFIFSYAELDVLENKGHIMKALAEGNRTPVSSAEKSFVEFLNGKKKATSAMEKAWVKYLDRFQLEASLMGTEELYQEYISKHRH